MYNDDYSQNNYAPNGEFDGRLQMVDENAGNGKGLGIASLVCGICSIVLCCCMPVGVAGLILGIVAKKKGDKSALSTIGIVLSILALVIWVINLIYIFVKFGSYTAYYEYITAEINRIMGK